MQLSLFILPRLFRMCLAGDPRSIPNTPHIYGLMKLCTITITTKLKLKLKLTYAQELLGSLRSAFLSPDFLRPVFLNQVLLNWGFRNRVFLRQAFLS